MDSMNSQVNSTYITVPIFRINFYSIMNVVQCSINYYTRKFEGIRTFVFEIKVSQKKIRKTKAIGCIAFTRALNIDN